MDVRRAGITAATVTAAALLIACGFGTDSPPKTQPEPQQPAPATTTANGTPTKGAPARTTGSAKLGTLLVRSTAQTKTRVNCSDIQSEERITASDGPVDWTARAVDRVSDNAVGRTIGSVTLSPASGSLAEGAGAVVRIGGSFSGGQRFVVVFEYPTKLGSGRVNVELSC
ncbi:hypothetical protein Dvina_31720 [Dactylosporangium vinaceum]|uniref:Lipoprotein n=1 Tax=Dactylosporangium vinaceum TaxID=53362 RepID=A0ABV5MAU7_9ACTN|nr:hypothetical protein [Dactylosporangium vinaceum]UAB92868.1 hypothetical protein Dvina_31720 [Dactylosporangium vinaceum]